MAPWSLTERLAQSASQPESEPEPAGHVLVAPATVLSSHKPQSGIWQDPPPFLVSDPTCLLNRTVSISLTGSRVWRGTENSWPVQEEPRCEWTKGRPCGSNI